MFARIVSTVVGNKLEKGKEQEAGEGITFSGREEGLIRGGLAGRGENNKKKNIVKKKKVRLG